MGKKKWVALGIEVLVICVFIVMFLKSSSNLYEKSVDLENMRSSYTTAQKGSLYIDESIYGASGEQRITFYGPYVWDEKRDENALYTALKAGTYTLQVDYECDSNQEIQLYTEGKHNFLLRAKPVMLDCNTNSITGDFELKGETLGLELDVLYNGLGKLEITNITIKENMFYYYKILFAFVVFVVVLNLIIFATDFLNKNRFEIAAILFITVLASLPLFKEGIYSGDDLDFHLMRIESIAEGLKNGIFPLRISSFIFHGYGYPTSIYYNDILLYIPAMLRLIGYNVEDAYRSYIVLVNLSTAWVAYFCFKKMVSNTNIAMIGALAYVTATYRLVNVYTRAAVGEYSAMIFFPIIALAVYYIYDSSHQSKWAKNGFILALGMSGLIGTHILSTEMVCLVLAFTVVCFFTTKGWFNIVRAYAVGVVSTVLLNLYFIVPLLDYYLNIETKISGKVSAPQYLYIGHYAVTPGQMVNFFETSKSLVLTPGLVLLAMLPVGILIALKQNNNNKLTRLTVLSVAMLWISSSLFPWDQITNKSKLWKMVSQVQFPFRFLGVACFLLTLTMIFSLSILNKKYRPESRQLFLIIGAVCIITMGYFSNIQLKNNDTRRPFNVFDVATESVGQGEYLIKDTDTEGLDGQIWTDEEIDYEVLSRIGNKTIIEISTNKQNTRMTFPVFNYKGYVALDDRGNAFEIVNGNNNCIQIEIPKDYEGRVILDFKEPWYWTFSLWTSAVVAAVILIYNVLLNHKKEKIVNNRELELAETA